MVTWSSLENFLRIWDMGSGMELVYIPFGETQSRPKFAWSPDGRQLLVNTRSGYGVVPAPST
jgi:WD40 repeat protein